MMGFQVDSRISGRRDFMKLMHLTSISADRWPDERPRGVKKRPEAAGRTGDDFRAGTERVLPGMVLTA
jgi:hypothetical protein